MIVRWLSIALLALVAAAQAAEPPAPTRLAPVDEAARDQSFIQFRNELKAVVARKDAAKLFPYLASDIHLSFGGDYGGPAFHKMWKPFDKDTKVWKALALVIDNGGKSPAPGAFVAPYVYATFPEEVDAFTHVVVTNKQAVVRDQPNANARILRKLDHDILTALSVADHDLVLGWSGLFQHEANPNRWVLTKDSAGRMGWVLAGDLRSPVDYRAIFEQRKGKWVIQTFLAGD